MSTVFSLSQLDWRVGSSSRFCTVLSQELTNEVHFSLLESLETWKALQIREEIQQGVNIMILPNIISAVVDLCRQGGRGTPSRPPSPCLEDSMVTFAQFCRKDLAYHSVSAVGNIFVAQQLTITLAIQPSSWGWGCCLQRKLGFSFFYVFLECSWLRLPFLPRVCCSLYSVQVVWFVQIKIKLFFTHAFKT